MAKNELPWGKATLDHLLSLCNEYISGIEATLALTHDLETRIRANLPMPPLSSPPAVVLPIELVPYLPDGPIHEGVNALKEEYLKPNIDNAKTLEISAQIRAIVSKDLIPFTRLRLEILDRIDQVESCSTASNRPASKGGISRAKRGRKLHRGTAPELEAQHHSESRYGCQSAD